VVLACKKKILMVQDYAARYLIGMGKCCSCIRVQLYRPDWLADAIIIMKIYVMYIL
jgi:hypothetical protein